MQTEDEPLQRRWEANNRSRTEMGFNELTQTEHTFFIAGQGGNTDESMKMWPNLETRHLKTSKRHLSRIKTQATVDLFLLPPTGLFLRTLDFLPTFVLVRIMNKGCRVPDDPGGVQVSLFTSAPGSTDHS